jgi:drug/metabolite transporter (DMT)-like permease
VLSEGAQTAIGTLLALAAAAAFGTSSVLQYRATHRVPEEPAGRPTLLLELLHRRNWRWSIVLAMVAFGLQAAALKVIPLIMVQPLLVTGLMWYVLLYAALEHTRPDRAIVLESTLCLLSLSAFLLLAQPGAGQGRGLDSAWDAVSLGAFVVGGVAACLLAAAGLSSRWRPLPLALAAGLCYGVTAGLTSSLLHQTGQMLTAVPGHWQLYAIILLGPAGVLLSQNSYQAGPLGAPALATITVTDPLVAIGMGLLWLDERIRTDLWHAVGEVLALGALVVGVFMLAKRAPHVA